ncbi:MAG: MBL fold metallo-hydrolase [Candidatus Heimdallarchaeota archaeon]|nr:MAG: MBL fold metallo-hydrolase [Candidatus Heimdallarchaeota archaeon]
MKQIFKGITWLLGQGLDCNVFIIESEGKSLMIDSGLGGRMTISFGGQNKSIDILEKAITSKNISQIFLTHGHIDHVGGIMDLQSKLDLEVITSKIEAQHLKKGDSSYIEPFMGSKCSPIDISQEVFEGDVLQIGNFSFEVYHTPGHTYGSISLWERKKHILISGDTVFPQGSFGRTDLLTGNSKDLVESLKRLSKLEIYALLPGHMPPVVSTSGSPLNSINESFQNARMMLGNY